MTAMTHALSAALLHFVWQGAIVGFLLWLALGALEHRSANARYAAGCAALVALAALPVISTVLLYQDAVTIVPVAVGKAVMHATPARGISDAIVFPLTGLDSQRNAWLARLQLWALPVWSAGVLLFSIRLVCGGAHAFVLGRRGEPAGVPVRETVAELAWGMGIERPVRVLISTLADGPSVLGWLRPVILLPPATAMGSRRNSWRPCSPTSSRMSDAMTTW